MGSDPIAVSVIVPVYNVKPYVSECIESLIKQKLDNIEILIINDGSTDGTSEIVEAFSHQYNVIQVVSQKNQGLSAARNLGLKLAKGDYIGFVDGDDWVDELMYSTLYEKAVSTQADIVISNGQLYNHQTGELKPIQDFKVWESLKSKYKELFFSPRIEPDLFLLDTSVCKRLYKKDFLNRLHFFFPFGKIFEDVPTHYKMLLNTEAVALVDENFYFYRTNRPGRITATKDKSLFHIFDVMEQVINDLYVYQASNDIWANYIWFQSWVLNWLRNQIDQNYLDEFNQKSADMAGKFQKGSISLFQNKFDSDKPACLFVSQQLKRLDEEFASPDTNTLLDANNKPQEKVHDGSDTSHLGVDAEGGFSPDPETFMPDIWGWICLQYGVKSVLDIGCGMGSNLVWFYEYGFDVLGVEGHPAAVAKSKVPGKIICHDFTKGPWAPDREFDLCLCTEFAEHVEAKFENNWMAAADKCRYILLAAAPPDQGGYHHVNEQPDQYWIDRFSSRGFRQNSAVTDKLRGTCKRKPALWGRNTLMFFERDNSAEKSGSSSNIKVVHENKTFYEALKSIYTSILWWKSFK